MKSRRTFLKAGLAGTLLLASAGGLYRVSQGNTAPAPQVLDDSAIAVLTAIIPVVLRDAVEASDIAPAIARIELAIGGLPLHTQKEVKDLFALLTFAPTRRVVAGVSNDWPQARPEEVESFLQGWRLSRFALLESAYHALHDLIVGSWYADESTWAAIGYPGPMKELS
jgi:hypothetical protein